MQNLARRSYPDYNPYDPSVYRTHFEELVAFHAQMPRTSWDSKNYKNKLQPSLIYCYFDLD